MWTHSTIYTPTRTKSSSLVCGHTYKNRIQFAGVWTHNTIDTPSRTVAVPSSPLCGHNTIVTPTNTKSSSPVCTIGTPTRTVSSSLVCGPMTQLTHLQELYPVYWCVYTRHNWHTYKNLIQSAAGLWTHDTIDTPTRTVSSSPVCGHSTQLTAISCPQTQNTIDTLTRTVSSLLVCGHNTIDTPKRTVSSLLVCGRTAATRSVFSLLPGCGHMT